MAAFVNLEDSPMFQKEVMHIHPPIFLHIFFYSKPFRLLSISIFSLVSGMKLLHFSVNFDNFIS